jgi:glycosyltransferase involved in cell wall biosynthesis
VKDFPRARRVVERARERAEVPIELQTISGVEHEDMPTYMNAADVLLLTSKREGSPNTVKEALACNLPVVSTDVGDVRERLADVSYSTVGRTDDELVDGLVTAIDADEPSNGREAAREVGLGAMADQIVDVYQSALESY